MEGIRVYTTRWCGYCVRAKALLDARRLPYEEISLDDDPAFRQTLFDLTGGWSVPQIVIDGRPIGGYTELWRLEASRRARRAPRGLVTDCYKAWQCGQNHVPRPPTRDFAMGVPQRSHGSSSRP